MKKFLTVSLATAILFGVVYSAAAQDTQQTPASTQSQHPKSTHHKKHHHKHHHASTHQKGQ